VKPFYQHLIIQPRLPVPLAAALLALMTVVVYWPATVCDFINYDDNLYVTSNLNVQNGLTLGNFQWAFLNPVAWNWHPVTILSHMFDCQLFGLEPWGHHLTSILLHSINTSLVFLLLHRLTRAFWRSLGVAALFGVHPLHVESVVWVAERKDVLSTCFGLLALMFYVRYAQDMIKKYDLKNRRMPLSLPSKLYSGNYIIALSFYLLGLMSKPMLVTWPFVMLLLDYWPLKRIDGSGRISQPPGGKKQGEAGLHAAPQFTTALDLVREKIPFFILAAASSIVTFLVQFQGGALWSFENLPLGARIGNALISYCRYLGKLFWPTDLAVFYPHPGQWPMEQVVLAGGLILGISLLLLGLRRRSPFLLIAWLWYCGTLVPTIGLVQVGAHAMADRYAYIPSLGILIFIIWGACEWVKPWAYHRIACLMVFSGALVLCLGLTRVQIGYWKDSTCLFRHALEVTEDNYLAHNNLGGALGARGQNNDAIHHFQEAIRIKPDYAEAHYNLGIVLDKEGQTDEAIHQYQEAIRFNPDYAPVHYFLGTAFVREGHAEDAVGQFREAIKLNPDYAEARNNLGIILAMKGQTDEAIRQYQEAVRLIPLYAEAHYNLGNALAMKGLINDALLQFQEAVRLKPDYAEALNNLGIVLGMKGRNDEAIRFYEEAIRLKPDYAEARNNLGIALVRQGRITEAISQFQEAIRFKPDYTDARKNFARVLGMNHAPEIR